MKRQKTKINFSLSIKRELYNLIDDEFKNKSSYIEWLVQQDLIKNGVEDVEKIIL